MTKEDDFHSNEDWKKTSLQLINERTKMNFEEAKIALNEDKRRVIYRIRNDDLTRIYLLYKNKKYVSVEDGEECDCLTEFDRQAKDWVLQ